MSQTPNLDAARASLQQAIDQANAIVKPIIDAMREAGMLTPAPEPAPEPAAAPAVDDDPLASEAMQRLRAAYFANEGANEGANRADRNAAAVNVNADMIAELRRERDEARAELARVAKIGEQAALTIGDENRRLRSDLTRLTRERDDAEAEVERLRAAHCICGPASVISDGPNVDCPEHGQPALPSSDDEVVKRKQEVARGAAALEDLLTMLGVNPDERDEFGQSIAETLARAVLRARGGQEAGQ